MNFKNKETQDDKPQEIITIVTNDMILDTIVGDGQTHFVKHSNGTSELISDYYEHEGTVYTPIKYRETMNRGPLIMPVAPIPYENDEVLFNTLRAYVHKYVDVSDDFEIISCLYIMMTWVFEDFHSVPYLRAIGDFGSGKTRFLKTVGNVCFRGIIASGGTTTAPMFRLLDRYKGTLIIDEADYGKSDKSDTLVKILNSGYEHGMTISRCSDKDYEDIQSFEVFGPKVVVSREAFQDQALESRFIHYPMIKLHVREDIPRSLSDTFYEESEKLRGMLLAYRHKYLGKRKKSDELIPGVHSRVQQILQPLLTVALNDNHKNILRTYANYLHQNIMMSRGFTIDSDIIQAVDELIKEKEYQPSIGDIASRINKNNTDPNSSDYRSRDITNAKHVGNVCRKRLQFLSHRMSKGYVIDFNQDSNYERLQVWKQNLGITGIYGPDTNEMNEMNKMNKPMDATPFDEIPF